MVQILQNDNSSMFHSKSTTKTFQVYTKIDLKSLRSIDHRAAQQAANVCLNLGQKAAADSEAGQKHLFKIILLGDSGVGKTSFGERFATGVYNPVNSRTLRHN